MKTFSHENVCVLVKVQSFLQLSCCGTKEGRQDNYTHWNCESGERACVYVIEDFFQTHIHIFHICAGIFGIVQVCRRLQYDFISDRKIHKIVLAHRYLALSVLIYKIQTTMNEIPQALL